MIYPSDQYPFLLSITNASGVDPLVTTTPRITILNAVTGVITQPSSEMTFVAGTQKVYRYVWDTTGIPDGTYLALVSYAADGITVNGRLLDSMQLGDSRVTGVVALEATVAKDATAAKDATVMKFTDYQPPQLNPTILAIKSAVDRIPANPATAEALTSLASKLEDVHDVWAGTWEVNLASNTFTMKRKDGTTLFVFDMVTTDTHTNRIRR